MLPTGLQGLLVAHCVPPSISTFTLFLQTGGELLFFPSSAAFPPSPLILLTSTGRSPAGIIIPETSKCVSRPHCCITVIMREPRSRRFTTFSVTLCHMGSLCGAHVAFCFLYFFSWFLNVILHPLFSVPESDMFVCWCWIENPQYDTVKCDI